VCHAVMSDVDSVAWCLVGIVTCGTVTSGARQNSLGAVHETPLYAVCQRSTALWCGHG